MLESIATLKERQSGRKLLNAIEDNAIKRKLLPLLANIIQKQGMEATMRILKSNATQDATKARRPHAS